MASTLPAPPIHVPGSCGRCKNPREWRWSGHKKRYVRHCETCRKQYAAKAERERRTKFEKHHHVFGDELVCACGYRHPLRIVEIPVCELWLEEQERKAQAEMGEAR